jgi:hypothetical protein
MTANASCRRCLGAGDTYSSTGLCPTCLVEHARSLPEAERADVLARYEESVEASIRAVEAQVAAARAERQRLSEML